MPGRNYQNSSGSRAVTTEDTSEQDDDAEFGPRASIGRNLSQLMTSQLMTWIFASVLAVIVPRFLGPSVQGQLRLAFSLWTLAGIVIALGTSKFLQLEIARNRRDGLRFVGPTLVIRTLAFGICAVPLGGYVALTANDETFAWIMILMGVGALILAWSDTIITTFIGLERMSTPAVVHVASRFVNAAAVLLLIGLGGNVYGIVGIDVIASAGALVILLWRFHRFGRIGLRGWLAHTPRIVRNSLPFMTGGAALVLYRQIDVLVIAWAADNQDVGWYGTADVLAGSLLFPAVVVTTTIFPTLGRLHVQDPAGLVDLSQRTFSTLMLIAVPIGLGTMIVAPTFAPLLYGENFRETGSVLAILGPVTILSFGTVLFANIAQATGRVKLWIWVLLLSALLTVPLDIILVPWARDRFDNGAIGGAIAYLVTEGLQFLIGLWTVARFLLYRRVLWRIARILAAGGVMFSVGWPLRHVALPILVPLCAAIYGLLIVSFRLLTDDERHMVARAMQRFGVRTSWSN